MSDQPEIAPTAWQQAGAELAQMRDSMGISQREVSDALNLTVPIVAAIEAGATEKLPGLVFGRGYVRAYAKLLELDAETLVAGLGGAHPAAASDSIQAGIDHGMQTRNSPWQILVWRLQAMSARQVAMASAVLLVLLWLISWWVGGTEDVRAERDQPAVVAAQAEATPAQESRPVARKTDTSSPVAVESAQSPAAGQTAEAGATNIAAGSPADPSAPVAGAETVEEPSADAESAMQLTDDDVLAAAGERDVPSPEQDARPLTPSGSDRLSLRFDEDCWVEIKDMADTELFADLGRSGQTLEFIGAAPFRLLLGYAPGVELIFNGEPVALAPHTRNNVAGLVVGQ